MTEQYDAIIVGAGAAGCTAARTLAGKHGRKVLVIDRRNHIAGNCYDTEDQHGVLIHQYGPHIFHTNDDQVYAFLSRFTKWRTFEHEVVANIHGVLVPVPFNLNTLHMVFPEDKAAEIEKRLVARFGMESRVPILTLMEDSDELLKEVGQYVYENIYLHYTMKQWGKKPEEIDPAVTARVPVVITRRNSYFPTDRYQGVPLQGFTAMFAAMLDHPGITTRLGEEAADLLSFEDNVIRLKETGEPYKGTVIFTGALDELFGCRFGRLPYRTLRFDFEYYEKDTYQGHKVVNYTVSEDYTRITEYKLLTGQSCLGTTISKEYPAAYTGAPGEIPYYAINNDVNQALYEKYRALAGAYGNLRLLGRLAEYRYYNIDLIVRKAAEAADEIADLTGGDI